MLGEIAAAQGVTLSRLVSELDQETPLNPASALRVKVVNYLKKQGS
ncbi:MAG: ribbon-helix-helix domain-containing protein [Holosporaceae bacterium]|nr:MAG: ribbon-helix-helix domain-containing protein [Holosporaceae bacterium]